MVNKNNKIILYSTVTVLTFSIFAVFGLSFVTKNQQDGGVGRSSASAQEPADVNNDNKVDILDLSLLLSKWNTTDAPHAI